MFVFSFKTSKAKLLALACCVVVAVASAVAIPIVRANNASAQTSANYEAADSKGRLEFLSQFGWQVSEEPTEVVEVIIPHEFNDVYENYNKIQKGEGFDLSKYCGERVKRWTYRVLNYPGYEDSDVIYANLLIADGDVIGGDICNVELDGFMHGFTFPGNEE